MQLLQEEQLYSVWRLTVRCLAVTIPGGDATGQDALDGAAVEL